MGIADAATLEALEIELTTARADELLPNGRLDCAHYRAIHHHLFQDIYDWAGETRTVRISKGTSHFCYPEYIDGELARLFGQLAAAGYLGSMSAEAFAVEAASFLATLNSIHPFREGNGRTQLAFLLLLADQAGHTIDLTRTTPDLILQAMIASFHGDETKLGALILSCIIGEKE